MFILDTEMVGILIENLFYFFSFFEMNSFQWCFVFLFYFVRCSECLTVILLVNCGASSNALHLLWNILQGGPLGATVLKMFQLSYDSYKVPLKGCAYF